MYQYLLENDKNVIVVHWNAGKGRTGTSISCFLIYSGLAQTAEDAIKYYGRKRFSHGQGVTQPSQIRYVKYFEAIYKKKVQWPVLKKLKSLYFVGVPWLNGKTAKLYFEILDAKSMDVLYTTKNQVLPRYDYIDPDHDRTHKYVLLPEEDIDLRISGDLLFRFRSGSSLSQSILCRFAINVAFLGDYTEFGVEKLDPNSFKKDTRFPPYFTIGIITEKACAKCSAFKELSDLCQNCVKYLEEEIQPWTYIQGILYDLFTDKKKQPSFEKAWKLHFLGQEPDYKQTLDLDQKDISKIKMISASIQKDEENNEAISLDFFGKRLTVSK